MITEKGIAKFVQLAEPLRVSMRSQHKRQLTVSDLRQLRTDVADETNLPGDFALLPGGFQSAGVSEAPGGVGGVRQLPD